ncbi:MAG: SRPBCC family protein [Nocardioidaceae bacterium]
MTQQPGQPDVDADLTSVRLDVTVALSRERAFRVFTEQFDRIKPREHNLLQVDIAQTVLEPRTGGRVYDIGTDGSECHWGRVLAFEPPQRLLLAWLIGTRWQLETDPDRASEVEVLFVENGPAETRVELEHRHLERHGDGWEQSHSALASGGGWPLYLHRFTDLAGSA